MFIKLGGKLGGEAIISPEDFEEVSKHKWHQNKAGYAVTNINRSTVAMHRFIMKPQKHMVVDHKNYNKKEKRNPKTSLYIGVSKKDNKYTAQIRNNNKIIILLNSTDDLLCAKAYDKYVSENNIPNKKLNFPEDYPDYNPKTLIKTLCK